MMRREARRLRAGKGEVKKGMRKLKSGKSKEEKTLGSGVETDERIIE